MQARTHDDNKNEGDTALDRHNKNAFTPCTNNDTDRNPRVNLLLFSTCSRTGSLKKFRNPCADCTYNVYIHADTTMRITRMFRRGRKPAQVRFFRPETKIREKKNTCRGHSVNVFPLKIFSSVQITRPVWFWKMNFCIVTYVRAVSENETRKTLIGFATYARF